MSGLIEDAKALADDRPSGWLDPNLEPTPAVAAARKAYEERYGVSAVVDRAAVMDNVLNVEPDFIYDQSLVDKSACGQISKNDSIFNIIGIGSSKKRPTPSFPHLIGVCGRFGSGKDTIGTRLVTSYGYTRYAFADKLKDLARLIGWNGEKDEAGRALLQTLGIGAREILGDDVWVRALDRQIYPSDGPSPSHVVITDVRLPNEAEWIRSNGGQVWKVIRRGTPSDSPASNHVSETSVDAIHPDVIVPNVGSVEDLHWVVDETLRGGK